MRTVLLTVIFACSAIISNAASEKAYACEVTSLQSIGEAEASSSAIFSGKVTEFNIVAISSGIKDVRVALFEVDRYWKNPAETEYSRERVVFTAIDSGACGYDFEIGKSYLVYAHTQENGSLETSIGTRTMPLENAQEDIAVLGEGISPTVQGSWKDQLEMIPKRSEPDNTVAETNNTMLMLIGSGAAIAGVAAFFSLRRMKDSKVRKS
jgi:hypothetical protein